jgi:hypothetical protein
MDEAKYITIYKKGDVHIVDLLQKNVLIPKTEIPVDNKFINDICLEFQKITLAANRTLYEKSITEGLPSFVQNLRSTGQVLFKHLFPEDVQTALRESQDSPLYLRLDENLLHIPWELCHDGDDFLALKFRIGRQVLTGHKPPTVLKRPEAEGINMLIIIDPSETLSHAQREAEQLCSILEKGTHVKIEIIGGRQANKLNLIKEMQGKELVHFVGHSFYDQDQPARSGWILKDGLLTSEEISRITYPPDLVFSNSCQSLANESQEGYFFDEKSFGVGGGFMMAGVRNFIGPIWVIHDEGGVQFAAHFYQGLVEGKSLGVALQETKKEIIRISGLGNLLWAAYMLYGDPGYSLKDSWLNSDDNFQEGRSSKENPGKNSQSVNPSMAPPVFNAKESVTKPAYYFPEYQSHWVRNTILVFIAVILLGGAVVSFIPIIRHKVQDSIKNTVLDSGHPVSGPWGWKEGYYTLTSDDWEGGQAIAFLSNKALDNFIAEIAVLTGQPAWPDAGFGMIIASETGDNAVLFYIKNEVVGWVIQKDGQRGEMFEARNLNFPEKAHLKLTAMNGNYQVFVNGNKISSITHPLAKANIGVFIESRWKVPPGFKDIKVKKIDN